MSLHFQKYGTKGGEGGIELAEKVLEHTGEPRKVILNHLYEDEASLKEKIETVAREIYGADGVNYAPAAFKAA